MIIQDIRHDGISVDLDLEDLRLLRLALLSAKPAQLTAGDPIKRSAIDTLGAAIHAAVVACEALPAGEEVQK